MKQTVFFYKNVGIQQYNSFYKLSDIFNDVFKQGNEYLFDTQSKLIVNEINDEHAFFSYVREKENTNPNLHVKDKKNNQIIDDPLLIYTAFLLIDFKTNLAALIGDKPIINKIQSYILKNSTLAISEKQISFAPYAIDENEIKRKIRAAKKIKYLTVPLAYDIIKENYADLKEISHAIDEKKELRVKLKFIDNGINYADSVCAINEETFKKLGIAIDNEEEREEFISVLTNMFTRKVNVDIKKDTSNNEQNIENIKETLKKELVNLKDTNYYSKQKYLF